MEVIKDKLNIENLVNIDPCHPMGRSKDNYPSTIIFKLNKFKDKQKRVSNDKKLKNTEIYIRRLLQQHNGSKEIFVGYRACIPQVNQDEKLKL